ncbi:AGE family epimerase/isomerase [Vibrio aestuarianus]|uniref:Cellobiose 2-epimerase n=1 Tax=Vibrio aestuarianus TaxID=28171 RepID=A0AAX3U6U4_9VIBR|nr:AGE family epimerase/isomerase [Vibrio aestuarianus]WGK83260.1 AGE family epimerase/isomerase [Vibrio aestuarianus]
MLDLKKWKAEITDEATGILDFWLNMQDKHLGGFYCYADYTGNIDTEHEKAVLLHSRILWTFSSAYRVLGDERYLAAAEHCYQFMIDKALDADKGGVYWLLDKNGNVTDSQKHVYNQGFAIYALSEFYLASGKTEAVEIAMNLFKLIEEHAFDVTYGGYREAFDKHWNPIENQLVCDTAEGILAEKSMNTHLHVLEAYTVLFQATKSEEVEAKLSALCQLMSEKVVDETLHYGLFFTRDWHCVSGDVSYGHDIEGTWLMDDAAKQLKNRDLAEKVFGQSYDMACVTSVEGLDRDGAVFNELREGHLLDSDRIWWVQAEAMVGFFNAYQKKNTPLLLDNALGCWNIIQGQLKDRVNGEWFWKVKRNGQTYKGLPKVEPWKCPYHNGRACLEMIKRIAEIESYTTEFKNV